MEQNFEKIKKLRTNVIEQTLEDKKGPVVSFTSPTHESEFDGLALEHLSGWSEHADLQPLLVARGVKAAACPTASHFHVAACKIWTEARERN